MPQRLGTALIAGVLLLRRKRAHLACEQQMISGLIDLNYAIKLVVVTLLQTVFLTAPSSLESHIVLSQRRCPDPTGCLPISLSKFSKINLRYNFVIHDA